MATDISPAQCRAARALLSWSQQDLAKAAQVSTSTIADFERSARDSAEASLGAFRAAFEAQGVRFRAGGAVEADKLVPSVSPAGPGAPMRWIDATDIAQWAERRSGGQEKLPQMISDLILSAYGPAAYIRMPSGDSIQFAGLDGLTKTADTRGLAPAGVTAWEFGTQKRDKREKAQGDYDKRTREPGDLDPAASSFVFVTARRWPEKDQWAKAQRDKGQWADVRAYDADNLVHWLETEPAIGLRWAEQIGRRPKGLRQLAAVFDEWSKATQPPLPASLLLVDRDKAAAETQGWLAAPATLRSVQAESSSEAMAFLYAAIDPYPEPYRRFWLDRCVAPETDEAARDLASVGAKLVVVLNGGDGGLAQRLVERGHHVLVAYGSDVGSPGDLVRLPRMDRHDLERALIDAGVGEEKAHLLAAQAAGSLTILRRLMPRAKTGAPSWALKPSRALLAALLVGAWCDNRPADRAIVAEVAGMDYEAVVEDLAPLATAFDGPLRRSGEVWKLTSALDAWLLLAPNLTRAAIDRHAAAFQAVMSREDPDFDTRLEANWIFRVPQPENAPVSGFVRKGLTEALIVMATQPDFAPQLNNLSGHVDSLVRKLLEGASQRLWWSLGSDFQRLAEASPSVFLEILGEAIARHDRPLAPLFQSLDGALSPREFHHGLLWALETLAWSPDYLGETAVRLAQLDVLFGEERRSKRPLETLKRIFLPWSPQTFATAAMRQQAVNEVQRRYGDVGWALLRALAPTGHGLAFNGPRPSWRSFAPNHLETLTFPIVENAYREIGDALLAAVGDDLGRWRQLLEHWPNFDSLWRAEAVAALTKSVTSATSGAARDALREQIRDLTDQHRAFADAHWAMPEPDVAALETLLARLEPKDACVRHAWLFAPGRGLRAPGLSWQAAKAQSEALQAQAVREIADELGTDRLIAFALEVRQTYAVGEAIGRADLGAAVFGQILQAALLSDHANADALSQILLGWLAHTDEMAVPALFEKAEGEQSTPRYRLRVALALPVGPESWARIEAAGGELAGDYWQTLSFYRVPKSAPIDLVLARLIAAGRITSAVCFAGQRLDDGQAIASERLIELLIAAVKINRQSDLDPDTLDFRDRVVDIFKHLDGQADAQHALFALEWSWCGVLTRTDRPPRRLEKALAESPDFFITLLKLVYLPAAESGVSEEPQEDAQMAAAAIEQAYRLLDDFSKIPGRDESGAIDAVALTTWTRQVRSAAEASGRLEIADSKIGGMLSAAAIVEGQAWPPEAICEVIEHTASAELEAGFAVGTFNRRGPTTRMPGDGGALERVLVQRYRQHAKIAGLRWPRVRRLLERVAENYERQAAREDQSAEQRNW